MLRKSMSFFLVLVAVAALIILVGCEGDQGPEGAAGIQGPQGEPGPAVLNVVAVIKVSEDLKAYDMGHFAMNIYNAPSIPHVRFNNEVSAPDDAAMFEEGRLIYHEDFGLTGNDSAFLDISYTMLDGSQGHASSAISLPSQFFAADNVVPVDYGADAVVEWEMSAGADGFWVGVYCLITYTDSSGMPQFDFLKYDTIMAADDTTLTIPTSTLFPDMAEIMTLDFFGGGCSIRAVTGPWFPGEANNFTGDAMGIFVGATPVIPVTISLVADKSGQEQSYDYPVDLDRLFERRLQQLVSESIR